QLANVRMTRMKWQVITLAHHLYNLTHITKIKLWINALAKQVHCHDHNIHITGTLTITKQGTLNTIGTSKHAKLSSSYGTATVIVGMQTDGDMLTFGKMTTEIFNLVSKDIWR